MKAPLLAFLAGVVCISCSTVSQTSRAPHGDSKTVRNIAEGVVHRHIKRPTGPWNIHVVSVDLRHHELDIIGARAFDSVRGRETPRAMALRHAHAHQQVLAAINADFFNMQTGESDLSQVIEREIVKGAKSPTRAQFALDVTRTPHIERFRFAGVGLTSRTRFAVDAVNSLKDSTIVLFNRFAASYTRREAETAFALRTTHTSGDTIVTVAFDTLRAGILTTISDSVLVVRATRRDALNELALGDTVRLVLGFLPRTEPIKTLVGGLPRIVVDGNSIVTAESMEGVSRAFIETRHPRTGIGISRDGMHIMLVTVDGRQAASVGMSLTEFADLMIELGSYRALNLDGGGSTTMVVNGEVVNLPSDAAGERPVANALLVVRKQNAEPTR